MKSIGRILAILFVSIFLFTQHISASSVPDKVTEKRKIIIQVNGRYCDIPKDLGEPYLDKETESTMVPIRYIVEMLNCEIEFLPEATNGKNGFCITNEDITVKMNIGDKNACRKILDKEENIILNASANLCEGRSYVPLRFISEALNFDVCWERDEAQFADYINIALCEKKQENVQHLVSQSEPKKNVKEVQGVQYEEFQINHRVIFGRYLREEELKPVLEGWFSYRMNNGLPKPKTCDTMKAYANKKAMIAGINFNEKGILTHDALDGEKCETFENLYLRPKNHPQDPITAWKKSPEHNKIMLYQDYAIDRAAVAGFEFIGNNNKVYQVYTLNFMPDF
ncbi:MAG: stalk domain-containing protein [Tissierellia bacterium]|nr:stalk domain-containing protein [Tissierellia bacterium]